MIYQEESINVPGFTIRIKIWNARGSKPILCLHGKMDNAASFDFLAPLLPDRQIVAVDFPGTGFSSPYPEGVMPNWKNDTYVMLQLIDKLSWQSFDILAHSLGSFSAALIGITKPQQVNRIVFLDILGPTVNFIHEKINYLHHDVSYYLSHDPMKRRVFANKEDAVLDRMKIGNLSYHAAEALVTRGTIETTKGWHWTFDKRLRCVSSTLPAEDELRQMFNAIQAPIALIRARQGVPYPKDIFQRRIESIRNLTVQEVSGGHHVHMDDPQPTAIFVSRFLNE